MSGVATAIAGGSLVSTLISANAANSAAHTQADAENNALGLQENIYADQKANQAPYIAAGQDALKQIQANMPGYNKPFSMSDFQADPGYQFELDQGLKAIDASSAAHSGLLSGNELSSASKFAQNLASTEFGNAYNRYNTNNTNSFNRLSSLAGLGQTGVQNTNAAGSNMGANAATAITGAANASAAGQVGVANAINNGIGTGVNGYMNYNILNGLKSQPSTPSPYTNLTTLSNGTVIG